MQFGFSYLSFSIVLFLAATCSGRANVTLQLGLSYVGSKVCDETPYKVTVCVGERLNECRLFGPYDFYVQASCASYGRQESIEFVVEHVNESLRIDSSLKQINSEKTRKLHSITANLVQSRELSATSDDLVYIVSYRVSFICLVNYFGELCEVYCSSDAKEYSCGPDGSKICNQHYTKDESTGACIKDYCQLMPSYCQNGGHCVNKPKNGDLGIKPSCICREMYGGPRCEEFVYNQTFTTAGTLLPPPLIPVSADLKTNDGSPTSQTDVHTEPETEKQVEKISGGSKHLPPPPPQLVGESSLLVTDRNIWYQVLIFTIVAVCLLVVTFGGCIATGWYVIRLKAKAELLRRQQEHMIHDLRCVESSNMPDCHKQCSSMEYMGANNFNYNSSLHNYSQQPYKTVSPLPNIDPEQQSLILANEPDQNVLPPMSRCSGTLRHPMKQWDLPMPKFTSLRRPIDTSIEMRKQGCDSRLLPMISTEAYSCQSTESYGFQAEEFNNHLERNSNQLLNEELPRLNNILSLRPMSNYQPPVFDDEVTKNDFRDTCMVDRLTSTNCDQLSRRLPYAFSYAPPNQFADSNLN